MSTTILLALAVAAQAIPSPPLPDQRGLYRLLFADIHKTISLGHGETGIVRTWAQGYDVFIGALDCAPDGRRATCRFTLTRRPDGTPVDRHAGTALYPLGCRAELRHARGPDGEVETWRVRQWPGPAGTPARSSMRCDRHWRGGD